jgi:hypothetical protein
MIDYEAEKLNVIRNAARLGPALKVVKNWLYRWGE